MRGPSPAFAPYWGPRHGRPRLWRGSPGPRSQPLTRPPRSPLLLRQLSAMRPVPTPGYPPCRRRARGRGRGRGVACWGCGLRFPRVWGPLPGRGGRACCLGGGGGRLGLLRLLGRRWRPDQHRRLRQPPLLALRGGLPRPLRGDGGAGAGPAVVAVVPVGGAIGVCHHCYLLGMRGGRCALPTTSWCISAMPWAVPCGALRGGGGEGVGGRLWRQPRTGGGRWPSIGIGRGGGGATRPTRRATAPSLGRGPGPWAPGGRRVVPGGAALGGPP